MIVTSWSAMVNRAIIAEARREFYASLDNAKPTLARWIVVSTPNIEPTCEIFRLTRYLALRLNIVVAKRRPAAQRDAYQAVFAALAHPARRRVLLTIYFDGGAMSAGEIAGIFEHAWQTTTRHLRVLEAAGLIAHEKRGRMRIYRIQKKRLELARDWLAHFSKSSKP
jgi:DNA-binding transcriptional ArsR family regulator